MNIYWFDETIFCNCLFVILTSVLFYIFCKIVSYWLNKNRFDGRINLYDEKED